MHTGHARVWRCAQEQGPPLLRPPWPRRRASHLAGLGLPLPGSPKGQAPLMPMHKVEDCRGCPSTVPSHLRVTAMLATPFAGLSVTPGF